MRQGFEQINKRFDETIRRHDCHVLWLIALIATVGGLVVAGGKLWSRARRRTLLPCPISKVADTELDQRTLVFLIG